MQTTQAETQAAAGAGTLSLLVRQIRFEAAGINSYELVDPNGAELPPFDAGSHLDIHLPNGVVRQYSLCNPPSERHRYVIAVLRDDKGRGGSKALHDILHVQDIVTVSVPRNHFKLAQSGTQLGKVILLAGGIGVTPIKSMAHALDEAGVPFDLHYCARDKSTAAFADTLAGPWRHGSSFFHYDQGRPEQGLDIAGLLRQQADDAHLYYCGPAGFMNACAEASSHWQPGTVHSEHFKAPAAPVSDIPAGSFIVRIASTGADIAVGPDTSIAAALTAAGVFIPTSCEAGLCATCKIGYLEGEVEHHDYILDDNEHQRYLTACVSRAKSALLVLDL
ncbi:MAG: iron-sulfur protein [Massilia sp.]|nr:iron-sulfur protein [Massilia sp.]